MPASYTNTTENTATWASTEERGSSTYGVAIYGVQTYGRGMPTWTNVTED